jgi:hypothetical protein
VGQQNAQNPPANLYDHPQHGLPSFISNAYHNLEVRIKREYERGVTEDMELAGGE